MGNVHDVEPLSRVGAFVLIVAGKPSPSTHRRTTASGVGYSATRYARQRIRGSPWIRMRTRQTGPRRVMSR